MAVRTLRVGIAGLGVGSTQVLPAMDRMPEIELVAAADPRPEARAAFSERFGGRTYPDVEAMCADPDVEAVWVATPNQFHCAHVVAAAEAGKHVVVEKPMALSMDECERMIAAAEGHGVQLLCGHTQSFNPAVRAMRRIVAGGELGPLRAVTTWMSTDWMLRPRMPQELDVALGGGVVYRQGPHQVDTVRLLGGGRVRSVRGTTGQWMPERPAPGFYCAHLEFEDGVPATLIYNGYGYFDTSELTWGQGERNYTDEQRPAIRAALRSGGRDEEAAKESMRFGGQREGGFAHGAHAGSRQHFFGLTVATCERGEIRQSPRGLLVYDDTGRREVEVSGEGASRTTELRELYDAVALGKPVKHGGRWGMATLEVCLAIMQSSAERREILLGHQCDAYE
jgi:phthalate 4,5-cis-dihydrodiol dehydrogenase